MPVQTVIKLRRDTAANWDTTNPVLAAGEQGYETDTGLIKVGDGTAAWGALPYQAVSRIVQPVKNTTGSSIPKGSVVYISGATGGDALISLADADTEATSSKTIGLTAEAILNDGFGDVVCEGLLSGVNTSAATAGDSVWLSSTAGGFVFAAPPAKPAHSVYLGIVTRVHATEGEILIKVQNGYELNELHDVSLEASASIADNEVLAWNNASQMWVNQTASEAGLAISGHNHSLDSLNNVTITSNTSGEILKWNGAAWINNTLAEAGITPNPMTTAGDLIVGQASGVPARLGIGSANTVLTSNGTASAWNTIVNANVASSAAIGSSKISVESGTTTTAATGVGYMGIPPSSAATTGAYTITAADAGEHIYTTASRTVTIPANASVAFPIGTTIVFVSGAGATTTIAITSDTLLLAGAGTTGSRTLAAHGMATALKITATSWIISGNGLS